jgi:hypothetical protein
MAALFVLTVLRGVFLLQVDPPDNYFGRRNNLLEVREVCRHGLRFSVAIDESKNKILATGVTVKMRDHGEDRPPLVGCDPNERAVGEKEPLLLRKWNGVRRDVGARILLL